MPQRSITEINTPQSCCRFALAWADITPPVGIYHRMWGAARHERATGVHRPLTATAMTFRPGTSRQLAEAELTLIAVDHCLLWAREMEDLLGEVSQESDVPAEQIV